MTAEDFASRLDARRSGTGWLANCPAHDDRHASLSISKGDDGRVLLHCHAGCTPQEVVGALGLRMGDLFPQGGKVSTAPSARQASASPESKAAELLEKDVASYVRQLWDDAPKKAGYAKKLRDCLMVYRGWSEETLRRFEIGCNGQRFTIPVRDEVRVVRNVRQYHPKLTPKFLNVSGHDACRWFPRPPSRSGRLWITEGEPDCVTAIQHGLEEFGEVVTATAGAGALPKGAAADCSGRDVVVVFDLDEAGREGAEKAARTVWGFGQGIRVDVPIHEGFEDHSAATVCVLDLSELGAEEGEDLSDFFGKGGSADSLAKQADATAPWTPPPTVNHPERANDWPPPQPCPKRFCRQIRSTRTSCPRRSVP